MKISAAGKSFLEDARSILKQADEAVKRAGKVSHQLGILRVGFIESLSWHGVVPRSFRQFRRRHPDARLELRSLSSLDQVEAVRLGKLDAGYVYRPLIKDRNLAHVPVALHNVMLAVPQGHSLLKVKPLRLRDLRYRFCVVFEADKPCLSSPIDAAMQSGRIETSSDRSGSD